ncbi:MAG: hypothetical protein JNJ88_08460 [Planctomycetes bacterium]|nr:hypothetical protein [Planctomycetota bacterium]
MHFAVFHEQQGFTGARAHIPFSSAGRSEGLTSAGARRTHGHQAAAGDAEQALESPAIGDSIGKPAPVA